MGKTNKDRRDKDFGWGEKGERFGKTDKKKRNQSDHVRNRGSYQDFVDDDDEDLDP
jgi:hypothetical protein